MVYKEKDTKKWSAQWFETTTKGEKKKQFHWQCVAVSKINGKYSGISM